MVETDGMKRRRKGESKGKTDADREEKERAG